MNTKRCENKPKIMFKYIKAIAFDADDTLWDNQSYFERAEKRYCEILAPYADAANVSAELFRTEKANMGLLGYGGKAFTISLVENALRVSRYAIRAEEVAAIVETGKSLLCLPATPLPGVLTTLSLLRSEGFRMVLFTKGELLDQHGKLERSGLAPFFEDVIVVNDKNEETFGWLCHDRLSTTPAEILMVGNSLKSDIAPALAVGCYAAWIPFRVTWRMEHAEEFEHERMVRLDSIDKLPSVLSAR